MEENKYKNEEIESCVDSIMNLINNKEEGEKLIQQLISNVESYSTSILDLGQKKLDKIKYDSSSLIKTENGILYNEYGHYAVFVAPNYNSDGMTGLYSALNVLFDLKNIINNSNEDDVNIEDFKEAFKNQEMLMQWILIIPRIASLDVPTAIKFVEFVVDYLNELSTKNEALAEESMIDLAKNLKFENETMFFENLKGENDKQ